MAQNSDIGDLIMLLNPYTAGRGAKGQMDVYMSNPAPAPGGGTGTMPQIQLQMDDRYAGDWTFGGMPQKIRRAVRIRYRYPSVDPATATTIWVEDYLLIGYEGSGGGN